MAVLDVRYDEEVQGAESGYKIARGAGALDGSNPTVIATGLGTVVAAFASLRSQTAPGLLTSVLSAKPSASTAGSIEVYGWQPTGAGDTTLVASTEAAPISWVAVGT